MSTPWMKFFPSDWRADPALRMCSVGARGMWMEMLCIMHEADPYGSLRVNGRPVSDRQMASLAGASEKDAAAWISELEDAGVFSRDDDGVIISRRMLRDKAKAEADKANGRRGGNPKLRKGVNPPDNPQGNPPVDEGDKAQKPEARSQNEKEAPTGASKKRASRLPPDWHVPDDWIAEAVSAGLSREAALSEAKRMHNWSLSDRNGAKLDWRATWRNWFDRAARADPQRQSTAPPRKQTVGQQARDELKRMGLFDAPDQFTRLEDESDRSPGFAGTGIARRIALAASGRGGH